MLVQAARFFAATSFVSLAFICVAAPKTLIVQQHNSPPEKAEAAILGDLIASEMDSRGKVTPIVWSITDPTFRAAAMEGRLGSSGSNPNLAQAFEGAQALGCEYVLVFSAWQIGSKIDGHATLYRSTKKIWQDKRAVDAQRITENDLDNARRSLARSWSMVLDSGEFHSLKASPKVHVPEPTPGQTPRVIEEPPTLAPKVEDNSKLLAEIKKLRAANQNGEATSMLRDAIDAMPFDAELRIGLVEHLMAIGQPEMAGAEARRASQVLPDHARLRSLAAQAWIKAGKGDNAMRDLNEALLRNPGDAATRTALAELALEDMNPVAAIEHLRSITPGKAGGVSLQLGLALALLGEGDDLEALLAKFTPEMTLAEAQLAGRVLGKSAEKCAFDLRSLMQRALVNRGEPAVSEQLGSIVKLLSSRKRICSWLNPPVEHRNSHSRLLLAHSLLTQGVAGLRDFLNGGNEDTLADARIDLGEALKALATARESLADETAGGAKNGQQHTGS